LATAPLLLILDFFILLGQEKLYTSVNHIDSKIHKCQSKNFKNDWHHLWIRKNFSESWKYHRNH